MICVTQKEAHTPSGALIFVTTAGDTSTPPGSGGQQGLYVYSQKTVYICIHLKADAWGSGF